MATDTLNASINVRNHNNLWSFHVSVNGRTIEGGGYKSYLSALYGGMYQLSLLANEGMIEWQKHWD